MSVASLHLGWHWLPYRYSATRDEEDDPRPFRSRAGWPIWAREPSPRPTTKRQAPPTALTVPGELLPG